MPAPKRTKAEEEKAAPNSDSLFLSLMIILLAFFIVLNSMATLESERFKRAIRSIQTAYAGLGIFGQGVSLDEDSREVGAEKPSIVVMNKMYDMINQSLIKWGKDSTWIETYEDERRLVISMKDVVTFDTGSSAMNPRVFHFLDDIGELIKQIGIPVTVQGHSDSSGTARTSAVNWVLSAERAGEIAQYLIDGTGVPKQIVELEAFGDTRPVADNASDAGRALNRRVDLVFYKRDLAKLTVQQ
jgi:chemotaxis protein MotB